MLKDAALLTLNTELISLKCGMQLKDASAYNVQFIRGKPILIDHLSFYPYEEGKPWVAYRQFCQHFLAPLVLASHKGDNHIKRLAIDLDGIRLNYVTDLLPWRAKFSPGLLIHLTLHGMDGRVTKSISPSGKKISKSMLINLIKNLRDIVERQEWKPSRGWKDYETECNYSDIATHKKAFLVEDYLRRVNAKVIADLGCNVGLYSQVASDLGCRVIAVDKDPACIELLYKSNDNSDILPLVVDITNPSPAIGWENTERESFLSRLKVDTIMCLALIHHLAIGNNLPLDRIASFLARICRNLLIEWIPKEDSQVQRMLKWREDIFPNYTKEGFEKTFSSKFSIIDYKQVGDTDRSLYLMERL